MAIAAYYAWDRSGRPLTPAQPVRDIVTRMRAHYPRAAAANLFSWYADEAHYQADRPQDHTPYSVTPWPWTPQPYPYVTATDIMHRTDLGLDCNVLFAYWIVEARAGRMPWLKYMIWQGRIYDVRKNWASGSASGHYDHIHLSTRTDHINTSLGAWSIVPGASSQEEGMRLIKSPSTTVWLAPDALQAGKPVMIPLLDTTKIDHWRALGVPFITSTVEPNPAYCFVTEVNAPWPYPDPVELTEEQFAELIAEVAEAAKAGAAEGAPSAEEIADAVVDEEAKRLEA